jgi:hypothetical protein
LFLEIERKREERERGREEGRKGGREGGREKEVGFRSEGLGWLKSS